MLSGHAGWSCDGSSSSRMDTICDVTRNGCSWLSWASRRTLQTCPTFVESQVRPQLPPMPASLRKILPSAPSSRPCSHGVQCHRDCCRLLLRWLETSPLATTIKLSSTRRLHAPEMNLWTLSTNLWRGTNPPLGGLYNIILGKRRNNFHPRVSMSIFSCTRHYTTVLQANLHGPPVENLA